MPQDTTQHEWPAGIPRDYNELFRGEWSKFIANKVRRYNKVDRNFADIFQEISLRLIQARVLERFVLKSASRLPEEMTTQQACDYIGVTLQRMYHTAVAYEHLEEHGVPHPTSNFEAPIFMPTPLRGTRTDGMGVYSRIDVLDMDYLAAQPNSGWNLNQEKRLQRKSEKAVSFVPSGAGFKTYLNQAIHNHFANHCRSLSRHNSKEYVLDPLTVVKGGGESGNFYYAAGTMNASNYEGATPAWEQRLLGEVHDNHDTYWQIQIVDRLKAKCAEIGVDLTKLGEFIKGTPSEGGGPTESAAKGIRILETLSQSVETEPLRPNETMDHRIQRLIEIAIHKSSVSYARSQSKISSAPAE